MPASRATSTQARRSARMRLAISSGPRASTAEAWLARRSCTSRVRSKAAMSSAMRRTSGAGVPAGASSPYQTPVSTSGWPSSASVGTSGSSGVRCGDSTAKGRICPLRKPPMVPTSVPTVSGTSPATTSCIAGAVPL